MALIEVDDDLWQAQDPSAAELSPRNQRWLWLAVLGAVFLAVAVPVSDRLGVFRPQVRAAQVGWDAKFIEPDGQSALAMVGNPPSADVSSIVGITNAGWASVRILSVSVAGPGFRFDHATARPVEAYGDEPSPPGRTASTEPLAVLAPGRTTLITLYFHITDCHAVTPAPRGITVRIDSWHGTQTVTVPLPTIRHNHGGWTLTDPADPHGINSIRYLADASCQVDMGA